VNQRPVNQQDNKEQDGMHALLILLLLLTAAVAVGC
jgi:hypothetical protein